MNKPHNRCWMIAAVLATVAATDCWGGDTGGAPPRPSNLPVLKEDVVVVVAGSSVTMNRYPRSLS
jgi:hypothetical protein